ncbi:hypothetical protein V5O48_011682 [Marasmius crinis-equi]|uniref:Uncharacterized protein n=1 Tax=Marasmius crinis-equi TaxID=585013 RepID=A0ABR3F571_9AGAR
MSPTMPHPQVYPPPPHTITASRPTSPSGYSRISDGLPYRGSPSVSDFEVEKVPRANHLSMRRKTAMPVATTEDDVAYRESVSRLLTAATRVSTVSGYIPLDPSHLILFFRTKSGITHSLDFPIDIDYNTPPAFDVLLAACRPHQTAESNDYSDKESLFYPPNLPLTTSLEIGNHPILDAVRSSLFPLLPQGHYLTVVRDKMEVVVNGGRMGPQSRALRNDGRVATIIVTLPVRFRGGALIVRDAEGYEEKFFGRGGKSGDMEWVAFSADCDYEVELVQKGCRVSIVYGVFLKTYGASGVTDPLINPSDVFLDLVTPVLNYSRGRCVGFYVACDYGVNPAEVIADTLVPMLKGGDSLLYHALKLYKLTPELRWTAGGYIWPRDRPVEISNPSPNSSPSHLSMSGLSLQDPTSPRMRGQPPVRGTFGLYSEEGAPFTEADLRHRVVDSGAIPLGEADITVLTDWNVPSQMIGKERVSFVAGGEMEKLVVNALIVVFVP